MPKKIAELQHVQEEKFFDETLKFLNDLGDDIVIGSGGGQKTVAKVQSLSNFGKGKKVLIIDDEESIRLLLKEILCLEEYNVIEASDGKAAMQQISSNPDICLVLLDLHMPNMNGIQFLQMVRTMKIIEDVPILLSTGKISEKIVEFARKMKVNGVLIKPFSPPVVLEKIKSTFPSTGKIKQASSF